MRVVEFAILGGVNPLGADAKTNTEQGILGGVKDPRRARRSVETNPSEPTLLSRSQLKMKNTNRR